MGSCKMKGKTRCYTGLINKQTKKAIFANYRTKHGEPKKKVNDVNDRPLMADSFLSAMRHPWFRKEVESIVLSGEMGLGEIKEKVGETISHNKKMFERKPHAPKGSVSVLVNKQRRKRNEERRALGVTMKRYRKLQKKNRSEDK